jgi:hypothetical protein
MLTVNGVDFSVVKINNSGYWEVTLTLQENPDFVTYQSYGNQMPSDDDITGLIYSWDELPSNIIEKILN